MAVGNRDIVSGSILLILSVAMYLAIPGQVETLESDTLSPAFLPMLITGIIGLLSVSLLYLGVSDKTRSKRQLAAVSTDYQTPLSLNGSEANGLNNYRNLIYSGFAIAIMTVYTTLIPWIGYLLSTAVALAFLAVLFGNRNWKQILVMMLIAPPTILFFFRYTLLVLLPQGKIFG